MARREKKTKKQVVGSVVHWDNGVPHGAAQMTGAKPVENAELYGTTRVCGCSGDRTITRVGKIGIPGEGYFARLHLSCGHILTVPWIEPEKQNADMGSILQNVYMLARRKLRKVKGRYDVPRESAAFAADAGELRDIVRLCEEAGCKSTTLRRVAKAKR